MDDGEQATTFLSIRHKIVFIGNPTAGKTSLLNRICNDKFQPNYDSTIGVDFFTKTIYYNETIFKLQLWDSAGQEKYRSLIPSYIRGASIIFLIYDLSHRDSFESINNWLGFVNQFTNKEQVKLVLVGNKNDLERKVTFEEGSKLAKKEGMSFFETSAKTGDGVINMFFTSFALIDFFNDKKDDNNNDMIIKELIEQNVNKTRKAKSNQNPNNIYLDKENSKNELIEPKSNKYNGGNKMINENNNINNNDNNNVIRIDNKNQKQKEKKKCGC
jgi:Ras-related protein Rab-6A